MMDGYVCEDCYRRVKYATYTVHGSGGQDVLCRDCHAARYGAEQGDQLVMHLTVDEGRQ